MSDALRSELWMGMKILTIDVGGTHVKVLATGQKERREVVSGPTMTPGAMVSAVKKLVADWDYDAVSIGYPGLVVHGKIVAEPKNLGRGWVGFNFHRAFGKPVRIINDAAMQALGSYHGGRMLFLGLGTGLGSAVIVKGVLEPMELAHLPYRKGRTYEDYLGLRGLKRLGRKRWCRHARVVISQLRAAVEADYVVLGGGNAKKIDVLPAKTVYGQNSNAFIGGFRLWRDKTAPARRRRARPVVGTAVVLVLACLWGATALAAGGTDGAQNLSIFSPASTPAYAITRMAALVLGVAAAIFVIVGGLLAYCVARFRRRPDDDGREPPQVYGSDQIELAWTMVPFVIVFVLTLATTRTIFEVQGATPPPNALNVTIVGHQWWWEIRYPELGVLTANELHVPVSDPANPTPTFLTLESADVIHSFWVPRLGGKMDVIPNRVNRTWIEPLEPGLYLGQCAEYCGTQHAHMLLRVYVHTAHDFERWVAAQKQPASRAAQVAAGRRVFEQTACINCHSLDGTVATGRFGPDLTHLMSRDTILAGAARNTAENLRAWINNPDALKPGALMPAMKLGPEDVDQLVAYLTTLQ